MTNQSATAPEEDLSAEEAVERYGVPVRTMAQRPRLGEIKGAYKVREARGHEWRVPVTALEAFGYREATTASERQATEDREVAAPKKAVAAERRRAERANRRVGEALLECGRLRARLVEERDLRRRAKALAARGTETNARAPQR